MAETQQDPQRPDVRGIDPARVESAVLRRLIAEVQEELHTGRPYGYDRMHQRHNRNSGGPAWTPSETADGDGREPRG